MLRIILWTLAILLAAGGLIYAIGSFLPLTHVAQLSGVVPGKTPAEIAARIRQVSDYPGWRRAFQVEDVTESPQGTRYVEVQRRRRVPYLLTEPARDSTFVSTILDDQLPYGGRWTLSLTAAPGSTRVGVREDGEIRSPVFRCPARFVFGHTASVRAFLVDLGATGIA